MGRMGKRMLAVAVALSLLVGSAQAATWATVKNGDCTALRTATTSFTGGTQATSAAMCCVGSGVGFCNRRMNFGDLFEILTTFTANGTYTTGGDTITLPEFQETGLGTFVYAECNLVSNSAITNAVFPIVLRQTPTATLSGMSIKLFTASAAGVGAGTEETAVSISGLTISCILYGYGA